MSDKVIKSLDRGYYILESDTRDCSLGGVSGWISYWIVNSNSDRIESFASVQRADNWWDINMGKQVEVFNAKAEKEAKSLVRRMGLRWDKLSLEEKKEWIDECTD